MFEGKFFKSGLVALQCVIPEASTLTFDLWGDVTRSGLSGDFTVAQTWNNHAHTWITLSIACTGTMFQIQIRQPIAPSTTMNKTAQD